MVEKSDISLRFAEPADAAFLAEAAVAASGGIYAHLLGESLGGIAPESVLAAVIAGGEGALSWRNGVIAEAAGERLGAAIAYEGSAFSVDQAIAAASSSSAMADLEAFFDARPPPGAFYLHAIWTRSSARGVGAGALLLDGVIALGGEAGRGGTALHVWADNAPALALYRSRGFQAMRQIDVPERPAMPHKGGKFLMIADGAG